MPHHGRIWDLLLVLLKDLLSDDLPHEEALRVLADIILQTHKGLAALHCITACGCIMHT